MTKKVYQKDGLYYIGVNVEKGDYRLIIDSIAGVDYVTIQHSATNQNIMPRNDVTTLQKESGATYASLTEFLNEFGSFFSSTLSSISLNDEDGNPVNVQNPIPTNGDTVYCKDIDVTRSNLFNFVGTVCTPFDNLHTVITDATTDAVKSYLVHFNRTITTPLIGLGSSEGGSFSNVKIIGILSGGIEVALADNSLEVYSAKTTQFFSSPNVGLNAVRFEFHTTNEIQITNIFIPKLRIVSAIPETAIVYASSYNPKLLSNGGSDDMTVDGSITPVDFVYEVPAGATARWARSFIELTDGNQNFTSSNFGAIVGGLINGVDIIVEKDGVEAIMENWKTNMDISLTMFDFQNPYRLGEYIGRWTIPSDIGAPLTLYTGDKIILRVNDDLTSLDSFRMKVKTKK